MAGKSEVARLLWQIEQSYQAAQSALFGPSQGTAQHDFISAKMERIGKFHEQLIPLVGDERAIELIAEILERA